MGLFDNFETDRKLEKEGVWFDYGGFSVKMRAANAQNAAYTKLLEAKTKPHRRAIELKTISPEVERRLLMEVYAATIITDWVTETVKDGDKVQIVGIEQKDSHELLEPTEANFMKTLTALPALFPHLVEDASNKDHYLLVQREEDSGNS